MKNPLTLSNQKLVLGAVQGQGQDVFAYEAQRVEVQSWPVDLEPMFRPCCGGILAADAPRIDLRPKWHKQGPGGFCFLRLWFPEQDNKAKWQDFNLLEGLAVVKNPIYFLLIGNKNAITHILAVDTEDLISAKNALKAKFPEMECEITTNPFPQILKSLNHMDSGSHDFDFLDIYTPPAYWRRLTASEQLKSSPLLSIYSTLSSLSEDEVGFFQVMFKPTVYPWHKNMLTLIEFESEMAKYGNVNIHSNWYYPGFGDKDNKRKVSSTIWAVSVRMGAFCKKENLKGVLNSLSLSQASFQFSGESLHFLNKDDYSGVIGSAKDLLRIVASGEVFHSGNLFNLEETSFFLTIPVAEIISNETYLIDRIRGFDVPESFKGEGVTIGYNEYLGKRTIVRQPEKVRKNHTVIIGIIDKGKSVEMENMILDNIQSGQGVGLIDPHGALAERVIRQIPRKDISRTILFELPKDPYTPICNFLKDKYSDAYKIADDNVNRLKLLFRRTAWGDNIDVLFRHGFYALCSAKLSFYAMGTLFARNSEGEKLRVYILPYLKNKEEELFWVEEFPHHTSLERVTSKLTPFLQPEPARRFFSQRENEIDFRWIMDNRQLFIAKLPAGILGNDLTNKIGGCLFSSFYNAGLSRMDLISNDASAHEVGTPFNLYIDESPRFPIRSLEDSLKELRKFNVRVNLALQQKECLSEETKSALANIGTWIVLAQGWDDAQAVFKEFYGEVPVNQFMRLKTGNGFIRVGDEITSIKTFPPRKIIGTGFRDEIIRYSREHYYSRVDEVERSFAPQKPIIKATYDEI